MEKMNDVNIKIENQLYAICKLNENMILINEEILILKNDNKKIEKLESVILSLQQKFLILSEENNSLQKKYSKLKEEVKENTARNINKKIREFSVKYHPKSPTPFFPTKLE